MTDPLIAALAQLVESALPWRWVVSDCPFPPAVLASMIEQELSDAAT